MSKLSSHPDVLLTILIAMIALFIVSILILMMMPNLPYIKNY
jgi:hypothetical protein